VGPSGANLAVWPMGLGLGMWAAKLNPVPKKTYGERGWTGSRMKKLVNDPGGAVLSPVVRNAKGTKKGGCEGFIIRCIKPGVTCFTKGLKQEKQGLVGRGGGVGMLNGKGAKRGKEKKMRVRTLSGGRWRTKTLTGEPVKKITP